VPEPDAVALDVERRRARRDRRVELAEVLGVLLGQRPELGRLCFEGDDRLLGRQHGGAAGDEQDGGRD
jgi:hypothetical protein